MEIKGVLSLSESIDCKLEVLGNVFEAIISNEKVKIWFPLFPKFEEDDNRIGLSIPLLPPEIGKEWKRGGKELNWGYPMRYPSGESCVELLAFSAECDEDNVELFAEKIYSSIGKWEHAFLDYLKIDTKQGTDRDKNIQRQVCKLELMADEYIPQTIHQTLYLCIPDENKYATKGNIEEAIQFANSGKELKLEYQLLLSTYYARKNNQNRQSIIDACAAIEICLIDNIKKLCSTYGLDGDYFLKKYKSLGDRFGLIRQLDKKLGDTDYQLYVVHPRNSVVHNSTQNISDEDTDKLIKCVEDCLKHYFEGYY